MNAKGRHIPGLFHVFALSWPLAIDRKAKETMSVRLRIISAMQQIATEQQVTLPPLTDNL
jgi:hypothetical protein